MESEDYFQTSLTDEVEPCGLYSNEEVTRLLIRLQREVRFLEEYIYKATGKRAIKVARCHGYIVDTIQ